MNRKKARNPGGEKQKTIKAKQKIQKRIKHFNVLE